MRPTFLETGWGRLATILAAGLLASCSPSPEPPAGRDIIVWHTLGSWSGDGLLQTDPFESDTGVLRVNWETRSKAAPSEGTLRISVHSAVSGRHLARIVDHRGAGRDTAYLNEDPRGFYLVIESVGVDWAVEVAEGIPAKQLTDQ